MFQRPAMQRRGVAANIHYALARDPTLLFLNESITNFDPAATKAIEDIVPEVIAPTSQAKWVPRSCPYIASARLRTTPPNGASTCRATNEQAHKFMASELPV